MNSFLHNNGVASGEITIRMVSNTDKILETRSGMKNRSVFVHPCACVFVGDVATNTGIDISVYYYSKYWLLECICSTFLY